MLSFALALAAMVQTDAINSARQAYSACLRGYVTTSMEGAMTPEAFEANIASQCTDRATAFREALIQRDVRAGGARARAEEDAQMMMEDMRVNFIDLYRGEMEAAAPAPQPAEEPQVVAPETPEESPAAPATPE